MYFRARSSGVSFCGGCFTMLIGIVFLAVGGLLLWSTITFLPGSETVKGTITTCQYSHGTSSGKNKSDVIMCKPTIQFTTLEGQSMTFFASESSSSYHEGDSIEVSYHPATPDDARIRSFSSNWLFPLIFCGVGALLCLIGPILLVVWFVRRATGMS